jgi:nucleoside-diphosphate-sugar epimerase
MRILVTGANGFVGLALCRRLRESGHSVIGALRSGDSVTRGAESRIIGDMGANPPWHDVLPGVEVVIHLAALVHQMGKITPPAEEYRRVNAKATRQLAEACARYGVRRMVFLSSVKVNGECTPAKPFTEEDAPAPLDAYGVSKLEAEQGLMAVGKTTGLETVVVRPPLVYGPGVRANFRRLLGAVARVRPLIVPGLKSKRSMIALANLADILTVCAEKSQAANQVFLVSDNEDVTVSELMQRIAQAMNRRILILPATEGLLRFAARLAGKEQEVRRLVDPLQVSPGKAIRQLNWSPPVDMNAGLAETVKWYLSQA